MNFYILVEGKRTEAKLYPAWFSILLSNFSRVKPLQEVSDQCYYLFSANGYPSIIQTHFPNAVKDIKQSNKFHYLVLALDAGDFGYQRRYDEVLNFAQKENLLDDTFKLVILVQNVCIETWFLGNRKIISRNSSDMEYKNYLEYYNVLIDDPEKMDKPQSFEGSVDSFHLEYLRKVFQEKNITYNKNHPGQVTEKYYLDEIIKRTEDSPEQLYSFQQFLKFCNEVNHG
jgi:hypothetical protein